MNAENQTEDQPQVGRDAVLGDEWKFQFTLSDTGWRVESKPQASRLVTAKGITAVYRYGPIDENDAWLLKMGYEAGIEQGIRQISNRIKTALKARRPQRPRSPKSPTMKKLPSKPKRPANKRASGGRSAPPWAAVLARIRAYLTTGGAFNPELADHVAVRDLLIDCRDVMLKMQKGKRRATPSLPLAPTCRL